MRARAVQFGLGLVLVAWGVADLLVPEVVLRAQARLMALPELPTETLAAHKRRTGLVCILVGVLAIAVALW